MCTPYKEDIVKLIDTRSELNVHVIHIVDELHVDRLRRDEAITLLS